MLEDFAYGKLLLDNAPVAPVAKRPVGRPPVEKTTPKKNILLKDINLIMYCKKEWLESAEERTFRAGINWHMQVILGMRYMGNDAYDINVMRDALRAVTWSDQHTGELTEQESEARDNAIIELDTMSDMYIAFRDKNPRSFGTFWDGIKEQMMRPTVLLDVIEEKREEEREWMQRKDSET